MTGIFTARNRPIIIYGTSMALLLLILKWLEYRLTVVDRDMELYIGAIALMFMGLGGWLASRLMKPKTETLVVEKTVYVESPSTPSETEAKKQEIEEPSVSCISRTEKYELSPRELEVLQLMAEGLSNQEIADRLFVSLNTVKTHASKIFEKIDVKRRTQAVEKAKRLKIIA